MKLPILAVLCAGFALISRAQAGPAVTFEQAAKLAQEQLHSRGLEAQHYVSSLILERTTLTSNVVYWEALFTPAIHNGDKLEVGVRIEMDGSVSRLVKGSGAEPVGKSTRFGVRAGR